MKVMVMIFAVACLITSLGCARIGSGTWVSTTASASTSEKVAPASAPTTARVDFPTQIKPVLQAKCQPCHFSGGKVYAQMPFDRPETIKTMGTKLFTRIKDENERRLIRDFLAQE